LLCTGSTSGDVRLISCENSRLPRREAAGGGIPAYGVEEEVNYFQFREKSRRSFVRLACADTGQVDGGRGGGGNSCDGDPSPSVAER